MKLIDRLVKSYTRIDEARVKDNHRWNANDELATMNFIYKDFKKELGRDPGKPYMDDYALVVGVPGRQIGWMSEFGERLGVNLEENGSFICKSTGDVYSVLNGVCTKK